MKHAHLLLDAGLLDEAVRVTGERTYSGAVNRALEELVRRARARRILELRGSGSWEGDLCAMRQDNPNQDAPATASRQRKPGRASR